MNASAPIAPMPPSKAAWSFSYSRRALALALTLSLALHIFAWFATPYFVMAWQQPHTARFDAVLIPVAESPAVSSPESTVAQKRVTRQAAIPKAKSVRMPKAEKTFIAPENAIAVSSAGEASDEIAGNAVSTSDNSPSSAPQATTSAPEAPPTTGPALPEASALIATKEAEPEPAPPVLPSRISIAYKMTSSISDGVADYTWTRDGDRFEIDSSMQATGFIVGNLVGVLHQVSEGVLTPTGLQPGSFRIRRGDNAPDSADFLRSSNELKLTRAGESRLLPLPPLIQDMQSFLFQLAYDVPKLRNPDDRLEVLVTNARKVYRHQFRQVGIETIETRSGPVKSIHLRSEAADAEDVYEVWLATGNFYLPVKIRFFAGRFPIELIAASIRTTP